MKLLFEKICPAKNGAENEVVKGTLNGYLIARNSVSVSA